MSDKLEPGKIEEKLKDIEKQLSLLNPAFTEIAGDRVYQHALARLSKFGKTILAVVAVILAVIGISSYQEIVKLSSEKVASAFAEQVIPEIRKGLEPRIESQLNEVQTLIDQRTKQYSERLDKELAQVLQANEKKLEQQLTELYSYIESLKKENGPTSVEPPMKPVKESVVGYAYFGDVSGDTDKVENAAFIVEGEDETSMPKIGDFAVSKQSTVVRSRYPEFKTITHKVPVTKTTYDKTKVLGTYIKIPKVVVEYKNKEMKVLESPPETTVVGSIPTGKKVVIKAVKTFNNSIWVKLEEVL